MPKSRKGYVYFIGDPSKHEVKIGYSTDPEYRIRQVQSGNPGNLEVLFQFRAGKDIERLLHRLLAPSRLRGEWFGNGPDITRFADQIEVLHVARILRLEGLNAWPEGIESQRRAAERYDSIAVTADEIMHAAVLTFPDRAAQQGIPRRRQVKVENWPPAYLAA